MTESELINFMFADCARCTNVASCRQWMQSVIDHARN
ncbi:unnamed protein product, partial [marine sediment metagenome]